MNKLQYKFPDSQIIVDTLEHAQAISKKIGQPYKIIFTPVELERPACGWKTLSPKTS